VIDPRISLVTLGVEDVDRAVAFYHEGLGFPVERWDTAAFFDLDGGWLSVYPREALAEDAGVEATPARFDGVTLAHNVDSREAVDDTLDELVDASGTLTQPARETDWGGYSCYVADPDGHLWEVAWNPHADLMDV
jgi:catechol 2,3-dioxygenase-like lactoylglutathione lyase family enzyme